MRIPPRIEEVTRNVTDPVRVMVDRALSSKAGNEYRPVRLLREVLGTANDLAGRPFCSAAEQKGRPARSLAVPSTSRNRRTGRYSLPALDESARSTITLTGSVTLRVTSSIRGGMRIGRSFQCSRGSENRAAERPGGSGGRKQFRLVSPG